MPTVRSSSDRATTASTGLSLASQHVTLRNAIARVLIVILPSHASPALQSRYVAHVFFWIMMAVHFGTYSTFDTDPLNVLQDLLIVIALHIDSGVYHPLFWDSNLAIDEVGVYPKECIL